MSVELSHFKNWLDQWTNLWVLLTGVGTLALAIATFCVIRQTSKQHHDRFKPICFLAPFSGVDPLYQRHRLIKVLDPETDNSAFRTVLLGCVLQNVGLGPALNLRVTFVSQNGETTEPWELSPLGAGQAFGSAEAPLAIPIRSDKRSVFDVSWQIWLEYEDVFGKKFKAVHRSMTYDPDPLTYDWVGPEEQKKARLHPISWVAFKEK